jgi:tRNA(Ile)-lysidine synthase
MPQGTDTFLSALKRNLQLAGIVHTHEKLAVAVSGGRDSMVLLHALHRLGYSCLVLHVNYGLRGEDSDRDANLVEGWCIAHEVRYRIFDAHEELTNSEENNLQQAARNIRYTWFERVCGEQGIEKLLLAHHRSDQVETFFLQLFRGAGANGLSGMKLREGSLIRPLLDVEWDTIQVYAEENQVAWREDESNKKSEYTRNFLRNDVLPLVRQRVPQLDHIVSETCMRLQSEQNLLSSLIDNLNIVQKQVDKQWCVDLNTLAKFPEKERLLYQVLAETGIPFALSGEICANLTSTEERVFYFDGYEVRQKSMNLIVYEVVTSEFSLRDTPKPEIQVDAIQLDADNQFVNEENAVLISASVQTTDLHLRTWRKGDYFYPSGMVGKKKISDFWNDLKLDNQAKNAQWLLCCKDDIVWVVNRRKDRRFEVKPDDKTALKVRLIFENC